MARFSIWNSGNGRRTKDFRFIDRTISEFFNVSGTALFIHLYEGVYDQEAQDGSIMDGGITAIEDPVLGENRDRKYRDEIIEMRGTYNVADNDFDMKQFGLFLSSDTIFIEVHMNDMLAMCGRKIIPGDVIELPHQRDDAMLDGGPAINKYYVVEDSNRASDGYSSTWYPHIWRLKMVPMTATQEFQDILDQPATDPWGINDVANGVTIGDIATGSDGNDLIDINQDIYDIAVANFRNRNFETQQFWVKPGDEITSQNPWILAGNGIPPNGYALLGTGATFPINPDVGDYYLRSDYNPPTLFRRTEHGWKMQEINWRHQDWTPASRLYHDFLNNNRDATFDNDGGTEKEKQALSKVVRPRADFE
jgi:hypothetical protein